MWLARNKTGILTAHANKPTHGDRNVGYDYWESYTYDNISLPMSQFPEVTFENSPVEIRTIEQIAFAYFATRMCKIKDKNPLTLQECLEKFNALTKTDKL